MRRLARGLEEKRARTETLLEDPGLTDQQVLEEMRRLWPQTPETLILEAVAARSTDSN